ncbi:polymerase [Hunter Island virus]|uniref:RNA-directed RNA polymerase L n=1 Tax=Hunter Island virus TaxID=1457386 RepID=A0A0K0MI33_9VIRU|nr:polymerase [Hunter Island virus]AKC91376.1 polymerase [Hunter Island virus]
MNLDEICTRLTIGPGYNQGEPGTYDQVYDRPELPALDVSVDNDGVKVDIGLIPDSASQMGSSITAGQICIKLSEAYKINHDFTFGALSESTDRKLGEVFPIIHDGSDGMTPDVILTRRDGSIVVLEYTTTRSQNMHGLEIAFRAKLDKYREPILRRLDVMPGARIFYGIIVVGSSNVLTNVPLTQEEAEELMYRFCLANEVFNQARAMDADIELQKTEDELESMARANSFFGLFDPNLSKVSEEFPNAEEEMLLSFLNNPTDLKYVVETMSKVEKSTHEDMISNHYLNGGESTSKRLEKNGHDANDEALLLMNKMHDRSNKKMNIKKSTVKLPDWIVRPEPSSISVEENVCAAGLEKDSPYGELWYSAFLEISLGNVEGVISDPEKELEIAVSDPKGEKESDSSTKIKFHRLRPHLSEQSKLEFALQGVEGKKWRSSAAVQAKERESHQPLSPFVCVDEIEDFLLHNNLMMHCGFSDSEVATKLWTLVEAANKIHESEISSELSNSFKRNFDTTSVQWSLWVSALAQELAAAIKQHCKPGEFIIKKLMNWPIYVIIKPTKSSSHIFYSLAVRKEKIARRLMGGVFTETISSGEWELTEFKSLKVCKLTNLVNLPCTMLNAIAFWREKLGYAPWISKKANSDLREQVAMTFLMSLEDKSRTEEIVTLMRYSQMEGFVSQPLLPKPQKMLKKLEGPLRTKLQVFLFKKHIETIVRVASSPFKLLTSNGKVSWSGTFNPISGRSCSIEIMVNCWYMGYYKNKEETTEQNALGAMYSKIVEIEEEKPLSNDFLGWGDPVVPERHEFSRSLLRVACQSLEKEIENRHGRTWKQSLEERICRDLGSKNLLDLATMKASSNFSKEWEIFEEVRTKTYHRSKLIEKVGELIEKGIMWYLDAAGEAWKAVLEDGCMRICLFKKNQHGGLREIYVMDLKSRLIQFGIETMARCVCELSPHETVANPRLKSSIIENHGLKSAKQLGHNSININSSNDASKWNQGHYTTKLAMVLCWFVPVKFHRFIWSGISMFRRKRMMIDLKFLESISHKAMCSSDDPFRVKMTNAFHGNEEIPWLKKGCTYLETETGMMQGILHFTSSLLHSCVQSFYKSYFMTKLKEGIRGKSIDGVVDVLEGSDDSSIMVSFKATSDQEELCGRFLIARLLLSVKHLNPYFGIYSSEKSTINTLYVVEYNSEFHFHKQLIRPTLRWVAASHQISETEALASRQEDYANLLTQCLEGGASFSLTYIIQLAQCLHHYMLLGMFLHPLFGIFMGLLLEDKDPALGFFILDCPTFAGGAGFRFNLWRQCKFTDLGRKYAFYFNEIQKKSKDDIDYRALDSTSGGTLSHSVMIFWGDRQKYQKLLDKLGLPTDWIEQIDQNPSILYRRPRSKAELVLKLAEKIHSPGVISSLSKGHVVPRVVAAGVYLLSRHCFKFAPSIHGRGATQKASLIKLLVMSSESAMQHSGKLNPNQERMLFPQVQEYERVQAILEEMLVMKGKFIIKEKNIVRSRIELFNEPVDLRCRAEDLVAEIWFGVKRTKLGPRLLTEEWDKLRASFAWLSSSHENTLADGPFNSHVQFRNFIAHVDIKSRTVRLLGAPVSKAAGVSTIHQVLKNNFFPGFMLDDETSLDTHERIESVGLLKHLLFMILNGPYTDEQKQKLIWEAFCSFSLPNTTEVIKKSRTLSLCLIKNFVEKKGGSILGQIESAQSGIIGGFSKPQKVFKKGSSQFGYKGKGVWTGIMEKTNVQILIDGDGTMNWLEEIRISTDAYLFDVIESIKRLCGDLGVNNRVDITHKKQCLIRLKNFNIKPQNREEGCPVRLIEGAFRIREMQSPDEVFLRVRGDILNLSIFLQEGRAMNLISYRSRETDISEVAAEYFWRNKDEFSFGSKEPSCSWICMRSLDSWAWKTASKFIEEDRRTAGIDNTTFAGIVRDCFESSLRRMGLLKMKMEEAVEKVSMPISSQDLIDILQEDVDFSSVLEDHELEREDLAIDALDEEPKLWSAEIEEFGEAVIRFERSGKYYHVKFMDKAAESLNSVLGKDGCRSLLGERKCSVKKKSEISQYLPLLGLKMGDILWVDEQLDTARGLDEDSAVGWG